MFSPSLLTPSLIPVQKVFQKQKLNNLLFVAAFLEHPSTQECYYAMLAHMLMLAIPTLVSVSEGFQKNNVSPLVYCSGHYQTIQQQAKPSYPSVKACMCWLYLRCCIMVLLAVLLIQINCCAMFVFVDLYLPRKYVFVSLGILFGRLLLLHTFGRNGVAFVQGAG